MSKEPRIVLITTGIRRIAHYFPLLPGRPIGIINWNNSQPKKSPFFAQHNITRSLYAKLRGRTFASLEHVCTSNNLLYADIHKQDADSLQLTLSEWDCDLVITSNCSFVPTSALSHLSHGTLNMHPSWLPDYRGAEPILWQIAAGEESLATSIHRLSDEYDRGSVVAQKRTSRPHGANRNTLADITEVELGRDVLECAIRLLIDNPQYSGNTQPEKSPTPYAHRKNADAFAEEVPIDTLDALAVWDLMHYFNRCPAKWLGLRGWRKHVHWQPARIRHTETRLAANSQATWRTKAHGMNLELQLGQTTITLQPKFSSVLRTNK